MLSDQSCDQAPIHSRIPDEILAVIFLINTSKLVEPNHFCDPHSTTLATAQVCQRWRAVALDYPFIWSRIINYEEHSPLWIETLLARSGSTLIDVGEDSTFEPVKLQRSRVRPMLQSIFKRTASLKTVSLSIHHAPLENLEPIYRPFLGHPAPNLDFLFLYTSRSFPDCLYPLFANEAPCLRRLHLQECLIDLSSSVLSNLTELSVQDVTSGGPSVAEWLRVLKNIPTLRFLTLSNAISRLTEHEQFLPTVDLPHLALLKLSSMCYTGISLIDYLNIPPLCGIEFWLSDVALDCPKLLFFLSKQLSHWPQNCSDRYLQAKILGGSIFFGNSKRVGEVSDITELDKVEEHSRYSKDPILSLVLKFDYIDDSVEFFGRLLELYSSTFSTTTTLDLWVDQTFTGRAVNNNGSFPAFYTFRSFTNVKTLNLIDRDQSLRYLLPLFQHSCHPLLFPALQSLDLTRINMEDGRAITAIVEFLRGRAEAGIPLAEIKGNMSNWIAGDLSIYLKMA